MDICDLMEKLRRFAEARDWDQFHSPKNLAMALAAEVGELLEVLQWQTEEQSRSIERGTPDFARCEEELADIAIYLVRLCDKLGVDLQEATAKKLAINEQKYPPEIARGSAVKHSQREQT